MSDSPYIVTVTIGEFDRIVLEGSRTTPVLVDFWAAWCNPCRTLMPILARLAEEAAGKFILAKVNTEEEQELAVRYGVRSLPTVMLFRNGQPVDEFLGALPESQIRAFLDKHLPRASDRLLADAQRLLEQGDLEQAQQQIEAARGSDPDNPRAQLAYALLQAEQDDPDSAERALAALPLEEQKKPEVVSLRARLLFDRVLLAAPPAQQLEQELETDPGNSEARYQLAAHRVKEGDYESALELLLTLMQKDRTFGEDAGRKGMLAVFDILGGTGDLVARYRTRMFNALH